MTSWDSRFLDLAALVASWSKDPSTKVGAVVVRPDKTIASLGFNGFPRGVADLPERLEDRDLKLDLVVHAEENAILSAKEDLRGATLYVYRLHPCARCAASIIQAGIRRVVAVSDDHPRLVESFARARLMFEEAGVEVELVGDENVSEPIEAYYQRQIEWSARTFGPGLRTVGITRHIEKELNEIRQDPSDLVEWIDVVVLGMDGYWRHGGTARSFMRDLGAKQRKNFARDWPAPVSEDLPVEHVRTEEELEAKAIAAKMENR